MLRRTTPRPGITRLLLYDGACNPCSQFATQIERAARGWLTVRSLHESAMRDLLGQARPGWRWEPTLVELDRGQRRVSTGLPMVIRLLAGLGPRRALRITRAIAELALPARPDADRRRFLRTAAGGIALALALPNIWQLRSEHVPATLAQDASSDTMRFTGIVAGSGASIGVLLGRDSSTGTLGGMAYVCDGIGQADWFLPGQPVSDGTIALTAPSGTTLLLDVRGAAPIGTLQDASGVHSFTTQQVLEPRGIWRGENLDDNGNQYVGGWILQANGSQVGAITGADVYITAPVLDPMNPTVTVPLPAAGGSTAARPGLAAVLADRARSLAAADSVTIVARGQCCSRCVRCCCCCCVRPCGR